LPICASAKKFQFETRIKTLDKGYAKFSTNGKKETSYSLIVIEHPSLNFLSLDYTARSLNLVSLMISLAALLQHLGGKN
jgi:hypothetical protein